MTQTLIARFRPLARLLAAVCSRHGAPTIFRGMKRYVAILAVLAGLDGGEPAAAFELSEASVLSGGRSHDFRVEVARTRRQHVQGLMFRRHLDADAGMLFVYRRAAPVAMWMKNTYVPLDILFVDRAGVIVEIAQRTMPLSTTNIPSKKPVTAVLEVNAGTVARLGIEIGDRIVSPALPGPP